MSTEEDLDPEIPELIKKYVPGITRGLSWAKYSKAKTKGNAMKSEAFKEAKEQGHAAALSAPSGSEGDKILEEAVNGIWDRAKELTASAKKISETLNHQPTKEERDKVLEEARKAARKAGLQAAIAAGWEKGWEEGIRERDSD
tara:strand:+ start:447 stop:875 length:429 start_codon:yes stop_codon:yes gene_type:complete